MHWLLTLDVHFFRIVNQRLVNPVFDWLMPFVSGNRYFHPVVLLLGGLLIWKGGARGRLCVLMLLLIVPLGDGYVTNTIKHAVGRDRPFQGLPDVRCLGGKVNSGSMPSGHSANWFAGTMVLLIYYRRSIWIMLPAAALVAFSRIYNGVHYPSDVVTGAILGAGYAGAGVCLFNMLWGWVGKKWFPLWWEALPSLVVFSPPQEPEFGPEEEFEPALTRGQTAAQDIQSRSQQSTAPSLHRPTTSIQNPASELQYPSKKGIAPVGFRAPHATLDEHWLRLGYVCIVILLAVRWGYIAGHTIQLAEDEAYQWVWSKHLALSYYSKPPLIAYAQFLGTSIWGDTAFGVRFLSPLITAIMSVALLRFFAREVNARAGFVLLLTLTTAPLPAVGAVLMTVDPLSVLFWTAAMLAGWRAVQERSTIRDWLWVGLWMGLGLLSKYTELFQLLCWAVFFALWAPARKQLRRPGPYLALLVMLLCALPILIWNSQHQWATVSHLAENADVHKTWVPTLKYFGEFLAAEAGLLNPIFFVAMIWAAVVFWRRNRHQPLLVYCFSMGAPVFIAYLLHSFKSRILPNWIAPAVLPLFCLMVIYWDGRLRLGALSSKLRQPDRAGTRLRKFAEFTGLLRIQSWLGAGLALGAGMVIIGHNTNVVGKLISYELPPKFDHLHRVREWDKTALAVEKARQQLQTEGKPVFIIADHYGMTGQISFYLPEARTNIVENPLVYCRTTAQPENQFYFWPGYGSRKGQNAIYVLELSRTDPKPQQPPSRLMEEFESVTSLGVSNVMYRDKFLLRPLQLFACRGLK